MCHVSVHSGALAFFDRFSDFNHLFELLDQILLPIAVVPLIYILELSPKNILKTFTANIMNNFHVGNACFPYKAIPDHRGVCCFPSVPDFAG